MKNNCKCGSALIYEYACEPISSNPNESWCHRHCISCDRRWREHIENGRDFDLSTGTLRVIESIMEEKRQTLDTQIDVLLDEKDQCESIIRKVQAQLAERKDEG